MPWVPRFLLQKRISRLQPDDVCGLKSVLGSSIVSSKNRFGIDPYRHFFPLFPSSFSGVRIVSNV